MEILYVFVLSKFIHNYTQIIISTIIFNLKKFPVAGFWNDFKRTFMDV